MRKRAKESTFRKAVAIWAIFLLGFVIPPLAFASEWLVIGENEQIETGRPVHLLIVKPHTVEAWPESLPLRLISDSGAQEIDLRPAASDPAPDTGHRTYAGIAPAGLSGIVRVELSGMRSNRLVLLAITPDQAPATVKKDLARSAPLQEDKVLSPNEPTYFLVGASNGLTARFQISFKYRLFDPDTVVTRAAPWLENTYLGYTQTALWDLDAQSRPFHDMSFRPSLFWQWRTSDQAGLPNLWRAGYEHTSNGKGGRDSRSIDALYVQPVWIHSFDDNRIFVFAPKLHNYIDKSENQDIQQYQGYVDWYFRYGNEKKLVVTALLRRGTAGYNGTQLDLSYPWRDSNPTRAGGFIHFQVFNGYGESLLDYNLKRNAQFRVGFSIVR